MARETGRQDRSSRQAAGGRTPNSGRSGSAMGSGERTSRGQSAAGAKSGGEGRESTRREPAGAQRQGMGASGAAMSERTQTGGARQSGGQRESSARPREDAGTLREQSAGTSEQASMSRSQAGAGGDREQSIQGGREMGNRSSQGAGLSRQGGASAVRGPGMMRSSNPYLVMQRMAEDMDRLFEQFGFGRAGLGISPSLASLLSQDTSRGAAQLGRGEQTLWSPQVEVFERGGQLVIRADLPGVNRDDVHIEVENDVLTIRGERRDEQEERREGFYRSERSYGSFYRALPLPDGVDAEACEATYKDGVLEITLPAPREQAKGTRRIQVR